ncbi:MAG: alpha-glucosidase/alpha-galactosidase, partial [Candidatus Latescibacteria bacterium]|nr:alpha-glucosidase/alpha-galactosidase [Candidatus Latescibacterota bacterium]
MSGLKIVLVGGGSTNWTPRVVCNILRNEFLDGSQVVLYDLNPEALELTYALALKHRELAGCATTVEQTTDRSAAFDRADAVIVTISTGGLAAMKQDLEVPEASGIYQ